MHEHHGQYVASTCFLHPLECVVDFVHDSVNIADDAGVRFPILPSLDSPKKALPVTAQQIRTLDDAISANETILRLVVSVISDVPTVNGVPP